MTKSVYQKRKTRLIKKLDSKFSKLVRLRDKKCLKTGSVKSLQCSHIITRKNYQYRWNFRNAKTLSMAAHLYWWHKEPVEAIDWLQKELPLHYNWAMNHKHKDLPFFKNNLITLEEIEEELNRVTLEEIKDTFNPELNEKYNYIF